MNHVVQPTLSGSGRPCHQSYLYEYMKNSKFLLFVTVPFLFFLFFVSVCYAEKGEVNRERNKMIGYMLSRQLPPIHFSDKDVDDQLARAAFDLYLKQLDYQKRFLLSSDVKQLQSFAEVIDDNLNQGTIVLPETGYDILNERISQVRNIVERIMGENIKPDERDMLETDPEKLSYAEDLAGLEERWRKLVKAEIHNRYLDLEEKKREENKDVDREELLEEARVKVRRRFNHFFNRLGRETVQDHYDRFFNSVARAFDPHTSYMAPAKKEDFDTQMRGSFEGIGAMLREEDGYIKVVRILVGSASDRQGQLKAEDVILAVGEGNDEPVEITDMRLRDAVRLIRGPKGTEVRLTVRKRDGAKEIIPIVRDVVQIEDAFVKFAVLNGDRFKIGYINVPSFYRDFEKTRKGKRGRNSTDDTRAAILELKKEGVAGMILDLRDNGGGALIDSVDIAGLFIDSGPVVQVKNSSGFKRILEDEDARMVYGGPLVVLVNQFSASASEIVAAALQDYRRAVIVGGKHTHGKGTVQTILNLNEMIPLLNFKRYADLGALKVTIQKFYRINGESTQYKGVVPDIILPSLFQHLESGEQYLDYSLEWDQDRPVDYDMYSDKVIKLDEISKRSRERITRSEGLRLIKEEAERSIRRKEQTFIDLSLDSMRSKRKEEKEARKKVESHYRRFDDETQDDNETNGPGDDDKKKKEQIWRDQLAEDPYIVEAEMVITDLVDLLGK